MHRRSSDDLEWQALKKRIRIRDKNMCRFLRMLTPGEYRTFESSRSMGMAPIDSAHVFEVSAYPEAYINDPNVYCVCRGGHRRLDDWQNPVTGNSASKHEHYYWWWRIINMSTAAYDADYDYETEVRETCLKIV